MLKYFQAYRCCHVYKESVKANLERAKDMSVPDVRQHKEGEGKERTRAATQDEECDKRLRSA